MFFNVPVGRSITRLASHCDTPRLLRILELPVTPHHTDLQPSVFLQEPDDIPNFHLRIMVTD